MLHSAVRWGAISLMSGCVLSPESGSLSEQSGYRGSEAVSPYRGSSGSQASSREQASATSNKNRQRRSNQNRDTETEPVGSSGLALDGRPQWSEIGVSSGGRPIEALNIDGPGFGSLVVGSVAGHDPTAAALVRGLTDFVEANHAIISTGRLTIIKTLNPDGRVTGSRNTAEGVYLNNAFPERPESGRGSRPREIEEFLRHYKEEPPRRVIHVRSVKGEFGVIAASAAAEDVAAEAADWLEFKQSSLPGRVVAGSLERMLCSEPGLQVMTIGIPESTPPNRVWDLYGDVLLNLLQQETYAVREAARETRPNAANSDETLFDTDFR